MAVSLTLAQFAVATRHAASETEVLHADLASRLQRTLTAVSALIESRAPDAFANQAAILLASYWESAPLNQRRFAWIHSGAASILKRWSATRRATVIESLGRPII